MIALGLLVALAGGLLLGSATLQGRLRPDDDAWQAGIAGTKRAAVGISAFGVLVALVGLVWLVF